jgi:hypothetical protein
MKMIGKFVGESNPLYCINGKEYLIVGEDEFLNAYGVIDETGDSYEYDKDLFEITQVLEE